MNLFAKTIGSFFLILIFCVFINAQTSWLGTYDFDENGGKTVGGTKIFISHRIEIKQTDDGILATIQATAIKLRLILIGTVKTDGDKLLIYFDSYGETNMFENYEQGDLLLTLEKKTTKGKTEILTYWNKFQPIVPKNEKSGKVYFKRVADAKE